MSDNDHNKYEHYLNHRVTINGSLRLAVIGNDNTPVLLTDIKESDSICFRLKNKHFARLNFLGYYLPRNYVANNDKLGDYDYDELNKDLFGDGHAESDASRAGNVL